MLLFMPSLDSIQIHCDMPPPPAGMAETIAFASKDSSSDRGRTRLLKTILWQSFIPVSRLCTLIGSLAVSNIIVIIILLGGTLSFINYAVEEGGAGGAGSSISGQIVDSRRIIIRYLFGNSTSRENSFSFDINFGDDRQFCCTPFSGYRRAVSVRFHTALAESLLILLSYPSC